MTSLFVSAGSYEGTLVGFEGSDLKNTYAFTAS